MGADGTVVRKVEDVAAAVDAMFAAAGPFLVDVNTDDLVKR
jgi:thiamine pyrophosphate-dependent acetolactate synthase large subunit-like protein